VVSRTLRAAWLVLIPAVSVACGIGFYEAFRHPELTGSPQIIDVARAIGIPIEVLITFALLVPFVLGVAMACLIFIRKSDVPTSIMYSAVLVLLFAYFTRSLVALEGAHPGTAAGIRVVTVLAGLALPYLMLTFPTGKFDRGTRWIMVATVFVLVARSETPAAVMAMTQNESPAGTLRIAVIAYVLIVMGCTGWQVYRFRHTSDWLQRQQVKWAMLPLLLFTGYALVVIVAPGLIWDVSDRWVGWALLGSIPLAMLLPVGMGRAILSYRLYDINVVINRTAVYLALTLLLGLVYLAGVALLQALLRFENDGDLAVAASTLAVAALFQPARRRIQDLIDHYFNRDRYDAQRTIDVFSARLRNQIDLGALNAELLAVVSQTMQPRHVSISLMDGEAP
jgi:hypothetical protein